MCGVERLYNEVSYRRVYTMVFIYGGDLLRFFPW